MTSAQRGALALLTLFLVGFMLGFITASVEISWR